MARLIFEVREGTSNTPVKAHSVLHGSGTFCVQPHWREKHRFCDTK